MNKTAHEIPREKIEKALASCSRKRGCNKTSLPGVTANWSLQTKRLNIRLYLSEDGIRLDDSPTITRSLDPVRFVQHPQEEIRRVVDYATEDAIKKSKVKSRAPQKRNKTSAEKGRFTAAFEAIMKDSPEMMNHIDWKSRKTKDSTLTYLARNVCPLLDEFPGEIAPVDIDEIRNTLSKKAAKNKRSTDETVARHGVNGRLYRVSILLKVMYDYFLGTDLEIPLVQFASVPRDDYGNIEQIKALPDETRVKLASTLFKAADCAYAVGIAAVMCMGLRPGEVCALNYEDLWLDPRGFTSTYIYRTMINDGTTQAFPKTNAGIRFAVSGKFFYDLVLLRWEYLRSLGYLDGQIRSMPLVPDEEDPTQRVKNVSALSDYGRLLLLACGVSREQYISGTKLIALEPDLEISGENIGSVALYILRRDFISRCLNVCGMDPRDLDALIGHVRKDPSGLDFTNRDVQYRIAQQIDRHVLLPEHTLNPMFGKGSADTVQTAFSGYRLDTMSVHGKKRVRLVTTEPGASIVIMTTANLATGSIRFFQEKPDTKALQKSRSLILAPKPAAYYEAHQSAAQNIILPKYKKTLEAWKRDEMKGIENEQEKC